MFEFFHSHYFSLVVLGIEPRDWSMLGKHSTTKIYHQPHNKIFNRKKRKGGKKTVFLMELFRKGTTHYPHLFVTEKF